MLSVSGDHDDLVFSVGLHLRQVFGHFRRRRYREVAHDVEADVAGCQRCRFVAALEVVNLPYGLSPRPQCLRLS